MHVKADFLIFAGNEDQQVEESWKLLDASWTGKTFDSTTEPQFIYSF